MAEQERQNVVPFVVVTSDALLFAVTAELEERAVAAAASAAAAAHGTRCASTLISLSTLFTHFLPSLLHSLLVLRVTPSHVTANADSLF